MTGIHKLETISPHGQPLTKAVVATNRHPSCLHDARRSAHRQASSGASSNDGFGAVRLVAPVAALPGAAAPAVAAAAQRIEHGVGMTINVTVRQMPGGNAKNVQICHYAGGSVTNTFSLDTLKGSKSKSLGASIHT